MAGFYTMMENGLRLPFETEILGMTVTVQGIDITEDDQLVAVCRKGKTEQRSSLSELPIAFAASERRRVDRCVSILANRQNWMTMRMRKKPPGGLSPFWQLSHLVEALE